MLSGARSGVAATPHQMRWGIASYVAMKLITSKNESKEKYTMEPPNVDTLGPRKSVLIREVVLTSGVMK